MKIKSDFVTNSSSVSFVVMGCEIDWKNISKDVMENLLTTVRDKHPNIKQPITMEFLNDYLNEFLPDLFAGTDLDCTNGQWGDELVVGIPYDKMKENETLSQFRDRAKEEIKRTTGLDVTPTHIEKCWFNN